LIGLILNIRLLKIEIKSGNPCLDGPVKVKTIKREIK